MSRDDQTRDRLTSSVSSHRHVFEIFLFINPLDETSLLVEQELLNYVDRSEEKVYFRLIPILDEQTVRTYCQDHQIKDLSSTTWNAVYQDLYDVCLAYKAALMQGKKKGRSFLLTVQYHFSKLGEPFSHKAMKEYAAEVKLDVDMWLKDIHSGQARQDFMEDIQLAQQMEVTSNPTFIIFDNCNFQYGLKVEQFLTADNLCELTCDMKQYSDMLLAQKQKENPNIHLLKH